MLQFHVQNDDAQLVGLTSLRASDHVQSPDVTIHRVDFVSIHANRLHLFRRLYLGVPVLPVLTLIFVFLEKPTGKSVINGQLFSLLFVLSFVVLFDLILI